MKRMMAEPRFWQSKAHPFSLGLLPLSWLYSGVEKLNRRLTHTQHPGKPVICIGNLTAGGAGKTPTVQLVTKWLRDAGRTPAILSRGFGGSVRTPLRVDPACHTAAQIGDEPLMLAADCAVYVGADRHKTLRLAARDGADIMVKDDGFQNPSMAHHFNLIVVDGATGIGNGRLLPAGPLRQNLSVALDRLDALLVIGQPTHASLSALIARIEALGKQVFYGRIISDKKGTGAVHGFCGIAKPEKFAASLAAQGYDVVGFTAFKDHHMFSEADAEKLLAAEHPLITTQKDMARLAGAPEGSARARLARVAHVLPISLEIDDTESEKLRALMHAAITAKQTNQPYKLY